MTDERNEENALAESQQTSFNIVAPDPSVLQTVYANFAQIGFSPHDFRLSFGMYAFPNVPEPSEEAVPVPVQPVVSVAIPLNLAKAIVRALESQIENWEKAFNEPVPEQPKSQEGTP